MLLDWVEHTAQTVDILLVAVDTEVIPCVALQGYVLRHTTKCEQLLAAVFLEFHLLALEFLEQLRHGAMVLGDKRIKNLVIFAQGEFADEGLGASYVLHQQVEHNLGVLGAHHQTEHIVVLLASLLVLIHYITTYEQEYHKCHEGEHRNKSANIHNKTYDGTYTEGHTGGDKPSTDYGEHSSDAEHCTLATPCTVGKRCTHCHHEGDVGG